MAHANARMDDAKVADGPGIQEEPHPRRSFWTDDVALPPRTYMPILLTLSFSAACIDVFSIPALGVFVANNTGNLILLALAVAQLRPMYPDLVYPKACIISLALSWSGSYVSGILGRRAGPKKRAYLFGEFMFQAALTFLCVGLYYGKVIKYDDDRTEYITIALMSFTMGSQNVIVKAMKTPPTIPTQVATGAMADLVSDPNLFAPYSKNRPRNERLIFVIVFFLGGVVGGFAYRYSSPHLSLLLTAIGKLLAGLGFLFASRAPAKTNPTPQVASRDPKAPAIELSSKV